MASGGCWSLVARTHRSQTTTRATTTLSLMTELLASVRGARAVVADPCDCRVPNGLVYRPVRTADPTRWLPVRQSARSPASRCCCVGGVEGAEVSQLRDDNPSRASIRVQATL